MTPKASAAPLAPSVLAQQVNDLSKQVAELKSQRVTYMQAPVTAVNKPASTFTAQVSAQADGATVSLAGIASPTQFLPVVGNTVTIALQGAQPVYQPAIIAPGAVSPLEVSPNAPAAPAGLTLTASSTLTSSGAVQGQITATWTAPTLTAGGSALVGTLTYSIQYRVTGTTAWTTSTATTTTALLRASSGLSYDVQVAAVDQVGNVGAYTAVSTVVAGKDTTPPAAPTAPVVGNYLGQLKVTWDGALTTGAVPADFAYVEVHASATTGFTPSSATLVSQLSAAGSAFATAPYGTTTFAKLIAVDFSGNKSGASAQASGATSQVVGADILAGAVAAAQLSDLAVTTAKLVDGAVINAKIAAGAVATTNLVDTAVTTAKIAAAAVGTSQIADASVITAKIAAGAVATTNLVDTAVTTAKIAAAAVGTSQIADASVINAKIGVGAVATTNLVDTAVTTAKIAAAAVDGTKIASLAVGTANIADGAIVNAKIGTAAVNTANIASAAITTALIGNLAVGTAQIANSAITSAQIANLAVTTADIADGAILNAKIGTAAVNTANIASAAITTALIANLAVGTAQIANSAITSAQIANLAVTTADIADGAILNAKIGTAAVNTANIASAAITTALIGDLQVATGKIADLAVTTGKIGNLQVGTAQMADLSVATAKIADAAVVNAKIGSLAVNDAQIGTVSAGKITAGTMSAAVVVSGRYTTALTGARTEMNNLGFQKFDSGGNLIVSITGTQTLLQGNYKTAASGRRIEIGSGGTSGQVDFYSSSAQHSYVLSYTEPNAPNYESIQMSMDVGGHYLWNAVNIDTIPQIAYHSNWHEFGFDTGGKFQVGQYTSNANFGTGLFYRLAINSTGFALARSTGGLSATFMDCLDANADQRIRFMPRGIGNGSFEIVDNNSDTLSSARLDFIQPNNNGIMFKGYNAHAEVRSVADAGFADIWSSAFTVNSDIGGKTNIQDANIDAVSKVRGLRVRSYQRIPPQVQGQGPPPLPPPEIGLIAQESPPEIISSVVGSDGQSGIGIYQYVTLLAAALQQIDARVTTLEKKGPPSP